MSSMLLRSLAMASVHDTVHRSTIFRLVSAEQDYTPVGYELVDARDRTVCEPTTQE